MPKFIKVITVLLAPLSQADSEYPSQSKGSLPRLDYNMHMGSYRPNAK